MSYEPETILDIDFFKKKDFRQLLQAVHNSCFDNNKKYYIFAKQCFVGKWYCARENAVDAFRNIELVTKLHGDDRTLISEILPAEVIDYVNNADINFYILNMSF